MAINYVKKTNGGKLRQTTKWRKTSNFLLDTIRTAKTSSVKHTCILSNCLPHFLVNELLQNHCQLYKRNIEHTESMEALVDIY